MKTSADKALNTIDSAFGGARLVATPFPHFALPDLFDGGTAAAVLDWLERDAPWAVESRGFYIHHGCTKLTERVAGGSAAVIAAPETLECIRRHLERLFGTTLSSSRFDLAAHRMLPGHRIGVHTDSPGHGTETHRLLVNLNSGFDDEQGGHLILLDLQDPEGSAVIVRPLHNSAVAMEFSDRSWHCVDEIKAGKRYSLVYSFWTEDAASPPPAGDAGTHETHVMSEEEFGELVALLRDIGADTVPHSNRYLIDHLQGTCRLLQKWQCDGDVCKAGLFHSVFGTPSFPRPLIGAERAEALREAIGERALYLVRLFSRIDWPLLLALISGESLSDGGGVAALGFNDKRAIVSLVWANVLEQSRYVPNSVETAARLKGFYEQTAHLLPPQSHDDIRGMLAAG
ncbi:MAG: cyclophane-containing peptide 2OG-Fe(II) oxygenase YhhC [Pyrinomonadaceae bacterium]